MYTLYSVSLAYKDTILESTHRGFYFVLFIRKNEFFSVCEYESEAVKTISEAAKLSKSRSCVFNPVTVPLSCAWTCSALENEGRAMNGLTLHVLSMPTNP